MKLSNDLISQFVKVTKDEKKPSTESTHNGKVVSIDEDNKIIRVRLDGSESVTPVSTTVDVKLDDRVSVTIKNHEATITGNYTSPAARTGDVKVIEENVTKMEKVVADTIEADEARFKDLETEKLSATDIEGKYANIDFSNIGQAAMEHFYAESGLIKDVVIGDAKITGTLVGVTILGDYIKGGTIQADKLVIKGSDGLYYKLNTEGGATTSEQVSEDDLQNGLSGDIIVAKSITAEKVDVKDLVAFDATIGGFNITDSSLYSGVKESVNNTTRGIYLDKDGQIAFGDSTNHIKYFKDGDGKYKLAITAEDIVLSGKNISFNTIVEDTITSTVEEFYSSTSATSLSGGSWSPSQPTWTEGRYIWRRTLVTYGDGSTTYTPSEIGVCITGNTGPQGDPGKDGSNGKDGQDGTDGVSVSSVDVMYYKSTSATSLTGGSWNTANPGWENGKYIWSKTVITYTGDTPSKETTPVCLTGAQGSAGQNGSDGANGSDGSDGRGVTEIREEYYKSTSATSLTGGSWSGTYPGWENGKYIWTRSVISYTSGNPTTTTPVCVTGEKGDQGDPGTDGKDGVGVSVVDVMYYKSTSSTSLTGGSWNTTNPGWESGKYIWSKTVITYTDKSTKESTPVCLTGAQGATGANGKDGTNGTDGKDGANGSDGNSVQEIYEEYYKSTSATSLTGGSWSRTYPGWESGKYIWTRSVITYTDKDSTTTSPICVTGDKGATGDPGKDGAAGRGISRIDEKYAISSSNSTAPTTWYDSVQTMTATNKYLWNYEIINYTDGSTPTETSKRVIGVYGDKGSTGSEGKGISNIINYYLVTSSASGVTTSTSGWTTTMQTTSTTNKYLWNYEVITYTSGNPYTSTPVIIGTHGATGPQGADGKDGKDGQNGTNGKDGKGIASTEIRYQASTSGTSVPTGTWSTSIPSVAAGSYLWTRTITTYTDSTTTTSYSVGKMGANGTNGTNGTNGSDGRGVKSTAITYQASTSGTTTPTGTWSPTIPSVAAGSYLWTRTIITYTDNTTSTSYSVGKMGSNGADGKDGAQGPQGAQGYSFVASVSRPNFTEANWTTYGTTGHVEGWSGTDTIRNGCRIGDIFTIHGTATDTKHAHILYYKSDTSSGNLHGSCISHVIAERGAQGAAGQNGSDGKDGTNGKDGQMLYATCSTAAGTAAKVATLSSGTLTLAAGATVSVYFTYANTAVSPTLNISGTGAKNIQTNGVNYAYWSAGQNVIFTYSGSYWYVASSPVYANTATIGNSSSQNIYIDSDSVDIRKASTVLATFGENLIELGKNKNDAKISLCNNNAYIFAETFDDDSMMLKLSSTDGSIGLFGRNTVYADVRADNGNGSSGWAYIQARAVNGTSYGGTIALVAERNAGEQSSIIMNPGSDLYIRSGPVDISLNMDNNNAVRVNSPLYVNTITADGTLTITSGSTINLAKPVTADSAITLNNNIGLRAFDTNGAGQSLAFINTSDQSHYGYGSYSNSLASVYYNGNDIHIRSKNNVTVTGGIICNDDILLPNNVSYKVKNTSGSSIDVLRMNDSNHLIIGYGLYSGSANTNLYGGANINLMLNGQTVRLQKTTNSSSGATEYYFRPNIASTSTNTKCALGSSGYPWLRVYAANTTIATSDRRMKENIIPMGAGAEVSPASTFAFGRSIEAPQVDIHSELFDRLQPVQYNFINGDGRTCYGLVAQDVIEAMDELGITENELDLVHHISDTDEETGEVIDSYGIAYENLIALLIHEVQKLKAKVDTLETTE